MSRVPQPIRRGDAFFRRCPISSVKAVDTEKNTVDAMVSTVNVDRYREIVLPSAYAKRLDSYRRNPMHLWAHDPRQIENVIGKALDVQPVKGGFLARFQYAVDENPKARMALDLIDAGYLNAYSVGFYALEWITPKELDKYPEVRAELEGVDLSEVEVIFTDVELFEISLCAVPANRESLVVGRAAEQPAGTVITGTPEEVADALAMLFDLLRRQNKTEKEVPPVATPAEKAAPTAEEKSALTVRTKMDVMRYDAAARLRCEANLLEASTWYDDDAEDRAETREGLMKMHDEVRATIVAIFAEDVAEIGEVEAEAPGAQTKSAPAARAKAGRSISTENGKTIKAAHEACSTVMDHLQALVDLMDEGDDEDEEPEDVELDDDMEIDD